MNFLNLMAFSLVQSGHAPLSTMPPQWLYKKGVGFLNAIATKVGWANPLTGEQIVAYKPGTFEAQGVPVVPNYTPNAMGSSFLDANGNAQPTVSQPSSSTSITVNWVAPKNVTVTGYSVDVADITDPLNPVEAVGSPFAVAAGTTTEAVTGLTTSVKYKVIVSYTTAGGTTAYPEVDYTLHGVA